MHDDISVFYYGHYYCKKYCHGEHSWLVNMKSVRNRALILRTGSGDTSCLEEIPLGNTNVLYDAIFGIIIWYIIVFLLVAVIH